MTQNIDRLNAIAKPRSEKAKESARRRRENREWLRMSQDIAISVLGYLRRSGTTQKELAEKMGVAPAYISKLVKGQENLSLSTICRLQTVTGLTLISIAEPYSTRMIVALPPLKTITRVSTEQAQSAA